MDVRFIDTTFRDGSQSLWAGGMRHGMIEAVAETMDRAGFDVIEVPVGGNHMKKSLRDSKEDPWERARMVARFMPNTVKSCMAGAHIVLFEAATTPRPVIELYYACLARMGALNRVQIMANVMDECKRTFPWVVPMFRGLGLQVAIALSYTISPRHTDDYYAQKTREVLAFNPDAVYLKDQGGLLTMDRARTLLPAIVRNAGSVPVELHSHCTTGLAPLVYLEALKCGVRRLHTGVPPLANGSAQPSVFNVAANASLMGYSPKVDVALIRPVAERLVAIAKQDGLPIGAPLEYDCGQYVHQVPGGVISHLVRQLAEMRMGERLDEVLAESVRVRKDLGYPIMVTPHSQFVVTQAAINVMIGERYKHVIDEVILLALGAFGEDSGYAWMDENLKDRLLALPRARELAAKQDRSDPPLAEIRSSLGGPGVSDEEFLLRWLMKGEEEIRAMRAAGPPRQYTHLDMPLAALIEELGKRKQVRYVHVQRGDNAFMVGSRSLH